MIFLKKVYLNQHLILHIYLSDLLKSKLYWETAKDIKVTFSEMSPSQLAKLTKFNSFHKEGKANPGEWQVGPSSTFLDGEGKKSMLSEMSELTHKRLGQIFSKALIECNNFIL